MESRIRDFGTEVVSAGLVDTPQRRAKPAHFRSLRRGSDRLLHRYLRHFVAGAAGGAEGRRAGAGAQSAALAALDYEHTDTGEWLANCSVCCVPEISNAFARARIDFQVVSGIFTTIRGLARNRGLVPRRGRGARCEV